jgi:hypothetical protein
MIEVFKTDVNNAVNAAKLIDQIGQSFNYKVSFDLEDCDRIMRVTSTSIIAPSLLINFLKDAGFHAEVLEDIIPVSTNNFASAL